MILWAMKQIGLCVVQLWLKLISSQIAGLKWILYPEPMQQ